MTLGGDVFRTSEALAAFLSSEYGLELVRARVERGASSEVYFCDCGASGHSVLKVSRWYDGWAADPRGALEKVYQVSEALRASGVPLAAVRKNRTGVHVSDVRGNLLILLEEIPGRPFSGEVRDWQMAAGALGLFHTAGSDYLTRTPAEREVISRTVPVEKPYEESRAAYRKGFRDVLRSAHECGSSVCKGIAEQLPLLESQMAFVDKAFTDTPPTSHGLLHNDFNYANARFADDGSFRAFLDIDQLGVGPHIFDVANTIASFATEHLKKRDASEIPSLVGGFLTEYHRVHPLSLYEYLLILPSTQRWDLMRVLRTLRRHHEDPARHPELLAKVMERFIPRIKLMPELLSFLTEEWIRENVIQSHRE